MKSFYSIVLFLILSSCEQKDGRKTINKERTDDLSEVSSKDFSSNNYTSEKAEVNQEEKDKRLTYVRELWSELIGGLFYNEITEDEVVKYLTESNLSEEEYEDFSFYFILYSSTLYIDINEKQLVMPKDSKIIRIVKESLGPRYVDNEFWNSEFINISELEAHIDKRSRNGDQSPNKE